MTDETIIKKIEKIEKVPNSRFGSQPNLKEFEEEERANSRDLLLGYQLLEFRN